MQDYLNIVLLGSPGSGKGTQADLLKDKYQLVHASTGEMYRKEITAGTPLGMKAKSIIARGDLCPDDLTLDMLYKFCLTHQNIKGYLFDGVPRTIEQALMMEGKGYPHIIPVSIVVHIAVDEDIVVERLIKRATLLNRTDDTPEVIRQRIENYENQTKPLIEHYQAQNKIVHINGMQSVDEVFLDICKKIDLKMG